LGFSDQVCSVRFGGIYGPGRTRLLREIKAQILQLPPQRPYFTNRIHREDAAGVLRHLLRLGSVPSKLVAVDSEPADLYEVAEWISKRTDRLFPFHGGTGWKRGAGHKRCSNSLLRSLGYQLQFPTFREGYGFLLDEAGRSEHI
jgi:nucleoside-diphosphate-sugar epimerase